MMARPGPMMVTVRSSGPLPGAKSDHFGHADQRYENQSEFEYSFVRHIRLLIFNWRLMIAVLDDLTLVSVEAVKKL
jgi:hypothetical protein